MSERPFMQLYVSDFVGDTLMLSAEHVGAYMLLLIALWNAKGTLPNDEKKLARVARVSLKKWRAIAPDLMPFFEVEEATITHGRLQKELQKSERQSQSRSAAGVMGAAAKALKNQKAGQASASALLQHAGASPEPYRKNARSAGVPTEGVVLDRFRADDEELWAACEAVLGKPVPSYLQRYLFPMEVIEQARAAISAPIADQAVH